MEIPDRLLNRAMVELSPSEFKLLVWICRASSKKERSITLDEFQFGIRSKDTRLSPGVGLSQPTIIKCLKTLADKRFIKIKNNVSPDMRVCRFFSIG